VNQSWKEQKDHLCKTIKQISDSYGGDDENWLQQYCEDVVLANKENLSRAIIYFESVTKGSMERPYHDDKNGLKIDMCNICKYRLVFCKC